MSKQEIGYIAEYPDKAERFVFKHAPFTRTINSRGDKIRSKMLLYAVDYEEIVDNANTMKKYPTILACEPFLLDDELREKIEKWVAWANHADPKEYELWWQEGNG